MTYEISLILSESNVAVLIEALKKYKGKDAIIAECIKQLVARQVEMQKSNGEK